MTFFPRLGLGVGLDGFIVCAGPSSMLLRGCLKTGQRPRRTPNHKVTECYACGCRLIRYMSPSAGGVNVYSRGLYLRAQAHCYRDGRSAYWISSANAPKAKILQGDALKAYPKNSV